MYKHDIEGELVAFITDVIQVNNAGVSPGQHRHLRAQSHRNGVVAIAP